MILKYLSLAFFVFGLLRIEAVLLNLCRMNPNTKQKAAYMVAGASHVMKEFVALNVIALNLK